MVGTPADCDRDPVTVTRSDTNEGGADCDCDWVITEVLVPLDSEKEKQQCVCLF